MQTHSQTFILDLRGGTVAWKASETDRERLRCELCGYKARAGGTTTLIPALNTPSVHSTGGHHLACVKPLLPTHTQPNLNLHCSDELHSLHPGESLGPFPTYLENYRRNAYGCTTSPTPLLKEAPSAAINRPWLLCLQR